MSTDSVSGQVRASDAEREEFATLIREAVGEGRLSLPEGDERLAQVYAARYRSDLRPLVADLPGAERGYDRYRHASGHGGSSPQRGYPPRRFAFARTAGFVLVVSAILVGLWAVTGSTFFWPAIPLTFFAISLARHGFGLGWGHRRWYR